MRRSVVVGLVQCDRWFASSIVGGNLICLLNACELVCDMYTAEVRSSRCVVYRVESRKVRSSEPLLVHVLLLRSLHDFVAESQLVKQLTGSSSRRRTIWCLLEAHMSHVVRLCALVVLLQ